MREALNRKWLSDLRESLHPDWRIILGAFCAILGSYLGLAIGSDVSLISSGVFFLVICLLIIGVVKHVSKPELEWLALLFAFICFAGTFLSGGWHMQNLPTEQFRSDTFVPLKGRLTAVEDRIDRPLRISFTVDEANKLPWLLGKTIRLNVRTAMNVQPKPGCVVDVEAILTPSSGPIVPGGYDFGYHALLQGIVAQGFAASTLNLTCEHSDAIGELRHTINRTIKSNMSNDISGIGVALVTGDRSGIDDDTRKVLRDAGLAHLLAISGLHMGLITGVAFFILEALFALFSVRFQRVPTRKLAAIGAFAAAASYLVISGAGIATTRAFIMAVIAIVAILADRRVISLRSLSFAAIVILCITPAAVVSISFHMSFAATAALIIFYERWVVGGRSNEKRIGHIDSKPVRYIIGVAVTSLVAQVAIAPFAFYHFQSVSLLGMSANLVAIPLMAFIVMPSALLGVLFIPIGVEFPFWLMEQGLSTIVWVAGKTAALPASTLKVPPLSPAVPVIIAIVFFLVATFRGRLPVLVALVISLGSVLFLQKPTATMLLSGNKPTIAYIAEHDGSFHYSGSKRSRFQENAWRQYWSVSDSSPTVRMKPQCVERSCITTLDENSSITVLSTDDIDTMRQGCSKGLIVVASYRFKRFCNGAGVYISKEDLTRFGPVGIFLDEQANTVIEIKWAKDNPFAASTDNNP